MKKERKNIVQILTEFGWAFYQTATVKIKGKKHTAFAIETYPSKL